MAEIRILHSDNEDDVTLEHYVKTVCVAFINISSRNNDHHATTLSGLVAALFLALDARRN